MISDMRNQQPQLPGKTMMPETMNNVDCLENQLCRVCDEKAAGFHFGAFTCEGCKSFFGRFCNNQTVIPDCKNNYLCVIDKRNRTSCKACRLKKCLNVGMSKSGCRYGRRSNWFKIHCLMQKNAQKPSHSSHNSPISQQMPVSPVARPPVTSLPLPRPIMAPHPTSPTPIHKPLMSSRSPSPLNTSLESSSNQSSPSPNSERKLPESPSLPPYFNPLAVASPLFDPL